ncbi:MAG: hypothetical protein HWD61_04900 [Parachlamydiaceae bacterium]|nr:MAG: hypothetical protein HWD61_04900 [Parachlamydiaceae bacterium]
MVHAIASGRIAHAQLFAGKGANLEQNFWDRNGYGISFHAVTSFIPKAALKFTATRYNPILYAAKNSYNELAEFLKRIGASTNCKGETIKVKRSISHIENQYHVSHHATHVVGGYGYRPRYVVYQPQVHHETIVHFQDKQKVLNRHSLDENLHYVTEAVQN